ncbi:hypothetical protein GCM10022419_058560 [Nonomuraea rosea]|uniref:Uncharacterized protein n=1 Tax=Nonomuraea rosea TaxID=638574 RepID=A0ABP6XPG7_9ACTN
MQVGRGGQAVEGGQVDVEHGDVRPVGERGGCDRVAGVHLCHDLYVLLIAEQGDQRLPKYPDILRYEHSNHDSHTKRGKQRR